MVKAKQPPSKKPPSKKPVQGAGKSVGATPKTKFDIAFAESSLSKGKQSGDIKGAYGSSDPLTNSVAAAKAIAEHAASLRTSGAKLASGDNAIDYANQQRESDRTRDNRISREEFQRGASIQSNVNDWANYNAKSDARLDSYNMGVQQSRMMGQQANQQRLATLEQRRNQDQMRQQMEMDRDERQRNQELVRGSQAQNQQSAQRAAAEAAQRRAQMLNFARGGL